MSTAPDIIEGKPDPLVENERGLSGARRFSIVAASQMDARRLLRVKKKIFLNVPWQSAYGEAFDDTAVARELSFRQRTAAPFGGKGLFDAVVRYGRRDSDEAVPFGPAVYRKGITLEQKKADLDEDGDPIVSSSNEPFDPGFTRPEPNELWTVTWWWMNTTLSDWAQNARTYDGALNTVTWQGAPPFGVLCHGLTNTEEVVLNESVSPAILGIKTQGVFEFRRLIDPDDLVASVQDKDGNAIVAPFSGFAENTIDRGYRRKVGVDANGKPIYETIQAKNGSSMSQPTFLDGAGDILDDAATPVAIVFGLNPRRADLNLLGI